MEKFTVIKTAWATGSNITFSSVFATLGLIEPAIYILATLMTVDTFAGVTQSVLNKNTSSKRLVNWATSKVFMLTVPLLLIAIWMVVGVNLMPIATWLIGALCFSHLISLIRHIHSISTGKNLPEYDAISTVISLLTKRLQQYLDNSNIK